MNDWLVWQLVDTAFPSGGFAHSAGLEAAVQWGELEPSGRLDLFLRESLVQASYGAIPIIGALHRQQQSFEELDCLNEALLSNHVANRASRKQGRALLASAIVTFDLPGLKTLQQTISEAALPAHQVPVWAAVTEVLEIPLEQAARMFLFQTLRSLISSAVRLHVIGPLAGQALQHQIGSFCESLVQNGLERSVEDISQTAPLLEMLQGTQDRMYSRLFQS